MKALCLMFLMMTLSAFAGPELPTQVSYKCTLAGTAVFISIPQKKVWMGDADIAQAMSVTVLDWKVYRCPHCYQMKVAMDLMGQTAEFELKMRTNGPAIELNLIAPYSPSTTPLSCEYTPTLD